MNLNTPQEPTAPAPLTEDTLPALDSDLGPNGAPLLMEDAPPADAPVVEPSPDAAPAASDDEPTPPADAAPEDGAPEPTADAPPADAPAEDAPPAERTYTQAEVSQMQSTMRERENEAVKRAEDAETATKQAQLLTRADEFERERTTFHETAGETPERAAALAKQDRTTALSEVAAHNSASETATAQRQAAAIAVGHDLNLPADEIRNLLQFNSVKEMQDYGQGYLDRSKSDTDMRAENARLTTEVAALKLAAVPAGGPSAIVDSASGETPALTDQQIIDRAGDPNVDMTDAEMADLDAAMGRAGLLDG